MEREININIIEILKKKLIGKIFIYKDREFGIIKEIDFDLAVYQEEILILKFDNKREFSLELTTDFSLK